MTGDDFDVTRVAEEVRQDQVISALTLKMCNSAIFARKRRIDSLVAVIRYHHYPEAETDYSQLTHIVYLADLLMSRFHTGLELERINTGSLITRLEKLNLPPSRFQDIVDLVPSNVFETADEPELSG